MPQPQPPLRQVPTAAAAPNTWAALLHLAHARHGDQLAVKAATGDLTYDQLLAAAARIAAALHAGGLQPGARVVIATDNRPEIVAVERALALWGWVRVAVSSRLHAREVDFIVADCAASLVICEPAIAKGLSTGAEIVTTEDIEGAASGKCLNDLLGFGGPAPLFADASPDDIVSLMYTSGTTGRPKGAINTQRNWHAMATGMLAVLPPVGPGDVLLHAAPMSHFSGSVSAAYIVSGAAIATIRRFVPAEVVRFAAEVKASCLPLVPTMLEDLNRAYAKGTAPLMPSLKAVPYGGSTISAQAAMQAQALLGDVMLQIYGMSEALIPVTAMRIADHHATGDGLLRLSSAGRPAAGVEVRIVEPNQGIGEIWVKGANVMPGYWQKPEQSAEVLSADGWYRSGDLGRFDEAGWLHIVDRKRDVVISGGFNVYPAEVERVIAGVEGVAAVSVIGMPHSRWGEAVMAVIVKAPGRSVTREQILAACRDELAGYKKPLAIEFVDELPRTSTGKVTKENLRQRFAAKAATSDRSAP